VINNIKGGAIMSVKSIDVSIEINSSIDDVFERMSDHGAYGRFPNVMAASLIQLGENEKNGKGAIRDVTLKAFCFLPIKFIEEIPVYQKPYVFEYKANSARYDFGLFTVDMGIIHHLGRISLSEENGKTTVQWVSKFEMTWPLVKNITSMVLKLEGTRLFMKILKYVKKESETG
jgi:hypothetical protein